MSVQQFCLRWNNHQPNFISVCSSLLHNGTLVDVTLAAEGRQLQAHKIVLSACSSYFQTLFTTNPCQHPIVILKDVQYNDLKTMVDFMYYGEVNVSQEQLPHILKTAEMLKIKGLAEMPADAATLTKSDSKSSSDQTDQLQGSGSGSDSIWGSTESQFGQQQQQTQLHQQQQQHQQQQMQHHHHHGGASGHHQQQVQSQQHHHHHHQLRRTPSPGTGTSPAARRKRIRKSSNNGSTERSVEEHSTVETSTNINLSQMNQMSFGGSVNAAIHSNIGKDPTAGETEHPHESSQESIDDNHQHHIQHIKPETDLSIQQSVPLDISGTTTPSDHDAPTVSCSQSQTSHSGVQWTVVDSNYPRFSLSSCQSSISLGGGNSGGNGNNAADNQTSDNNNGTGNSNNQQQQQQGQTNNSSNSVVTTNQQQQQQQQQGHIQMHYQNSVYPSQLISVNSLVGSYSQNLSTPTSPNESAMVQSVYSQGPTPTQSPVHQIGNNVTAGGSSGNINTSNRNNTTGNSNNSGNTAPQQQHNSTTNNQNQSVASSSSGSAGIGSSGNGGGSGNTDSGGQTPASTKRKRSVNPQGDENFKRALEAVRTGGIGFCKAARLYGVNNRTLWLEYKKRGYPISRPSIKNRIKLEPNMSPPPPSTPTNDDASMENYEHNINHSAINMQVPPSSDTPTPIMCTPHTHPMGVMNFLDGRHMDFSTTTGIHTTIPRQRYTDSGTVNVNPASMNLQGLNFNSM